MTTRAGVDRGPAGGPSQPQLVVAFVVLVILVGANIVAIRYTNRSLAPFWNAGLRFGVAAVLFTAIGVARGARLPDRRSAADGVVYGLLAFAGFFGFLYLGLVHASAGLGQVILALGPLITLVMAVVVGMERLRWPAVAGGVVALAGIGLMFGVDGGSDVPPLSILAIVAAAAAFAAGGIVVKGAGDGDPLVRNAIATAVGGIVLLSISAVTGERWTLPSDPATLLALAYLIVPGTVGIFMLFLLLLHHWTATAVSTQFVLAPIVGISLGWLLLGEPISLPIAAGVALVLGGVWLGALRRT